MIEIDQDYLDSLSSAHHHKENNQEGTGYSPHASTLIVNTNILLQTGLQWLNNQQISHINSDNNQEEGEGGSRNSPILHVNRLANARNSNQYNTLDQANNRQPFPADVIEFIDLCERGGLYDNLMRRLGIPAQRRRGFKRLFFSQVFFCKIKTTGRVRELFARDFPIVYKAINDLKRKDYRQLAYLLQAHESKIMIDVICRRILDELPGTFIATIHDSIMTTAEKADEVKTIMVREFQRFGLNPTIRLEEY